MKIEAIEQDLATLQWSNLGHTDQQTSWLLRVAPEPSLVFRRNVLPAFANLLTSVSVMHIIGLFNRGL